MNEVDPSTPMIVGAGQAVQRPGDWTEPADALGPLDLMTLAAQRAADDAGAAQLLTRLDWVAVVADRWPYVDPGRLVATRLGSPAAGTALSSLSGSSPQELVSLAARRIVDGQLDVALVLGGEATWSRRRLGGHAQLGVAQVDEPWPLEEDGHEPERVGAFPPEMISELRSFGSAAAAYALFEDSLRLARGETVEQGRDRVAALWARFSAVAADNPFAWDRSRHAAADIRAETADNRMITFPYTKALVANNTVDLASAVLLCSADAARAAGVDPDRAVFPHVGTTSHETYRVATRDVLHETPGLATAGRAAFDHARVGPGDIEHVDLYACFPAIVQMSAAALGLDPQRELTLTGGLGFAGAPLANSSGQALATLVPLVRTGGYGLVHANGGSATKHAFGIYGNRPPLRPFRNLDVQENVYLRERVEIVDEDPVAGTVEAATVAYDRDGPSRVIAMVRTPDGRRQHVQSTDADTIAQALTDGLGGVAAPLP